MLLLHPSPVNAIGRGENLVKVSDLFVKALENEGVKYIFGIPGEETLDLLESLKDSTIRLILTRHEQAAGFMAATYGRLTGNTGVCLATLGPGATNLVTAAAYAQLGGMPMLMITGQKPIKSSKQGKFQLVDVVNMMRPLTKFSDTIVNGDMMPSMVREAFRIAEEERPGAVLLELPEDIAREDTDIRLFSIYPKIKPIADVSIIKKAVRMIESAKKPLILIGAGTMRQKTSKSVGKFISKTGIPFFNTQMGKGLIDERDPLYLGTAALSDNDYLHCAIGKADLIINLGHDIIEKPPFFMEEDGAKVIHVNFFFSRADKVYFPQLDVVGDIAENVELLTKHITKQESWDFTEYANIKQYMEKHISAGSDSNSFPVTPQRLVADVRKAMPADGIVTLDNGVYKIWFTRNYKAYQPHTLLLDNALATMGAGFPSAIGARFVYPDKKILAVCGDGGFLMNSQELETAVRLKLNMVILVLNDGAYGMIKWKQETMEFKNQGLDFGNPDFAKYAESYGAFGYSIEKTEDLLPTLERSLNSPGVHLINLPVDYSENSRVLIDELRAITCKL